MEPVQFASYRQQPCSRLSTVKFLTLRPNRANAQGETETDSSLPSYSTYSGWKSQPVEMADQAESPGKSYPFADSHPQGTEALNTSDRRQMLDLARTYGKADVNIRRRGGKLAN